MKKTKIIVSPTLIPFLCSYTSYDSGKIVLDYHALTEAIKIIDGRGNDIEHRVESVDGLGNSHIVVHDTKNYSANVGNYVLKTIDRFCFYDTSSKLFHGFGLSL